MFILFVMTPGAQTIDNIAVYNPIKQLVLDCKTQIIKSTGIDFFTFYTSTRTEISHHQFVVATTGSFTLTSVILGFISLSMRF